MSNKSTAAILPAWLPAQPALRAGRIAWLENADGQGRQWNVHDLPAGDKAARGAYHSLAVADFDNDGDADIVSKLWRPRRDNANGGRNHADYPENLLIRKR